MLEFDYVYRWKKYRPHLFGKRCRVLVRGKMHSVLIEFESGEQHVVSRWAVMRAKEKAGA